MSRRSRRVVLRTFREMARELRRTPRQRWRPIVRLIARQKGWRFADAFLWTRYQGCEKLQSCLFVDRGNR